MKIRNLLAAALFVLPTAAVAESPIEFILNEASRGKPHATRTVTRSAHGGHSVSASWYGGGERLARHTANGEVFRPGALTAAHRSLPFGTRLLVTYKGRSVVVRVNDRGPAAWTGRGIDLSRGAARAIGMSGVGVGVVQIARL